MEKDVNLIPIVYTGITNLPVRGPVTRTRYVLQPDHQLYINALDKDLLKLKGVVQQ